MTLRLLVPVLALVAVAPGCVRATRFRYVHNQPGCFQPAPDPIPGKTSEQALQFPSVDCRSASYKIGFIEFGEDGRYIDAAQEQKALALIDAEKRRAPGGKVVTFVYVHGWKNNGNEMPPGVSPQDVERFRTALGELGYRARLANSETPVPIVGIYIGWRGKSLKGPGFFTFLSYWSRRNAANRIGAETLTAVLNRVIERTNGSVEVDKSRVVLVGHSFGARVLEHAIENGVTLYDEQRVASGSVVSPRVDLVLYVNSANDARLSMGRVQALQKHPITVRHPDYDSAKCANGAFGDQTCRAYPLLVALTSTGDLATKYLLPVATTLAPDRNSAPTPPQPQGMFADRTPALAIYRRAAAAHMRFMQSHFVTEATCPSDASIKVACSAEDPNCAFAFRTRGDCDACFKASARTSVDGKPPFNQTAFWIMNVDKRISANHGDIWNLSLLSMIGELMSPRGFFEPGSGRMQIQSEGPAH